MLIMTLLRARSRKQLTQIPKLPFINLSEELKAYCMDKCRYKDNGGVVLAPWLLQYSSLYPAGSEHKGHTSPFLHPPPVKITWAPCVRDGRADQRSWTTATETHKHSTVSQTLKSTLQNFPLELWLCSALPASNSHIWVSIGFPRPKCLGLPGWDKRWR